MTIWLSTILSLDQVREEAIFQTQRVYVSLDLCVLGGRGVRNHVAYPRGKELFCTLSSNTVISGLYTGGNKKPGRPGRPGVMSYGSFSLCPSINSKAQLSRGGRQDNVIQASSSDGLAHFRDTKGPEIHPLLHFPQPCFR